MVCAGPTGFTTANVGSAAGFDVNALSASYWTYRIVGWGARLRSTTYFSGPGEWLGATLPLEGLVPATSLLVPGVIDPGGTTRPIPSYAGTLGGPQDTLAQYLLSLGLPYSGSGNTATIDYTKIPTMPTHANISAAQAAARGLHVRSFPYGPDAYRFKKMTFVSTGTDSADVATVSGYTEPVQQYGVNMDPWKVGGFESLLLCGTGFAPSSSQGTLELVYHVEATFNPNIAQLARPACSPSTGSNVEHQRALASLTHVPKISFSDVVQKGEDMLLGYIEDRAGAAMQSGLDSMYGAMSRLVMAGG